jgi:hypothetical protein
MSDPAQKKSLADEIRKRKTETKNREIDARRTTQTSQVTSSGIPVASPPTNRIQSASAAPQQPKTQPVSSSPSRSTVSSAAAGQSFTDLLAQVEERTGLSRPQITIAAIIVALVITVLIGVVIVLTPSSTAPALPELPSTQADAVIARLSSVGVTLSDVQPAEPGLLQSSQGYTLTVGDTAAILLTYPDSASAGAGYISATMTEPYTSWQRIQLANIVFLFAPNAPAPLVTELNSHLTQFLVAPHRDYMPTSTPTP